MRQRLRRTLVFWQLHGTAELAKLIARKLRNVLAGQPLFNSLPHDQTLPSLDSARKRGEARSVIDIVDARFPALRPIKTFAGPASGRRISLITDSISQGSLFGGVGTALILASEMANRLDARLRIITRTEKAPPSNVEHVLKVYGLELRQEPQFLFASIHDRLQEVELLPDEVFLTTSWWTTAATLPAVPHENILYLLQEDERMFYPHGDDRLLCESVLARTDIRFLVNTELLFDHLVGSGLPNIATQGSWFEPAFPPAVFRPRPVGNPGKRRFFFYARPNNLRNLYFLGIQVIERAVNLGVLEPGEWEICLVGKDIPAVAFGGVPAVRMENLSWSEYAELIGGVDLGLCLMATPHPSYPPLDLAASGAVVVTNRFGNKQDLSSYSANILCADCTVDALVDGLREGVALSRSPARHENFSRNGLLQDWPRAFRPFLESLSQP